MHAANGIIPPHLNSQFFMSSKPPLDQLSHIDHICINKDGSLSIGCSNLTGRYWNGAACIYKSLSEAQSKLKHIKSICLKSGTNDGCFVEDSNKVLLCEDNGTVSIWCTNSLKWEEVMSAAEHDGSVLAVDCFDPRNKYVTVGSDANIKVWDINQMVSVSNYSRAHDSEIYGLSVRCNSKDVFATGSLDQLITLWDLRDTKSKLDLMENDCGIRCLRWVDDNRLLVGDEAGMLSLVDARKPLMQIKLLSFPAAVHRISLQPKSNKFAMCFDNKTVVVCKLSDDGECEVIYKNNNLHHKYIRGLAWDVKDDNILYSVGWDTEIKTHRISC